jgi:hypothetical protein
VKNIKLEQWYIVTDDAQNAVVDGPYASATLAEATIRISGAEGLRARQSGELVENALTAFGASTPATAPSGCSNAFTGALTLGESVSISGSGRERVFTKHIKTGNVSRVSRPAEALDKLDAGVYHVYRDFEGNTYFERKSIRSDDLLRFEDDRAAAVLGEIKLFWDLRESYGKLGLTHKRGVLLYGAPGGGKSCLLKQVVEDATTNDNIVIYPKSLDGLATILSEFRDVEPDRAVLVVLEDIDGLIQYNEHALLELFDGDDQMDHVLFLATTNYPDRLPPRVMRSGRFDTKLEIKNPPKAGRVAYLTHKLEGQSVSATDIDNYADLTEDFSFAQLREFIAATFAHKQDAKAAVTRIRRNYTE